MKLFYMPGACSLSPHIVLRELGLPFELEKVDTKAGKTASGADFKAINPKGYVPVLQLDDGTNLTEGPAIVQYLADLKPGSGLAPPNGTLARTQLQEWLGYINSEVHKVMGGLFNPAMPADWKAAVRESMGQRFDFLSARLQGRDYLTGSTFTVADAYLFVVLGWTRWVEIDLARWPALVAFSSRVKARPAVAAALAAEKG